MLLHNPLLRRFWFQTKEGSGYGVTAYSVDDARQLLTETLSKLGLEFDMVNVIEDVDIRDIDQNHVVPNMGPPNFRGVWYPRRNL